MEELYQEQYELYRDIKFDEFKSCNHILVCSDVEYDDWNGRTYKTLGCVKCGMDDSVADQDRQNLSLDRKVMYDYLIKYPLRGFLTNIQCDLDLAHEVYLKIKEEYPDIEDELAILYLEMELERVKQEEPIEKQKKLNL